MSEKNSDSPTTEVELEESIGASLDAAMDAQMESSEETDNVEIASKEAEGTVETEVEAVPEVVPPEHWSKDDQAAFVNWDQSTRDVTLRMDANFTKGLEEKANSLKRYADAIEPYRSLFAGGDEIQAIERLFQAQAYLGQNPVEAIKWLAKSYGVDEQFSSSQGEVKEDDPYIDPEVKRLRAELTKTQDDQTLRDRQLAHQQNNARLAVITEFKNAKDEQGKELHPNFDHLQPIMAGLLQSGRVADMEEAYQEAIKTMPEYIDSKIEARLKDESEKESKRLAEEADAAQKAKPVVNGKSDAKATPTKQSLEDALNENFDKSVRGEL